MNASAADPVAPAAPAERDVVEAETTPDPCQTGSIPNRTSRSLLVSHLVDFDALPTIDVWGETVRARSVNGERLTLALVELAPGAVVPEHRHGNEQMGKVVSGIVTFTVVSGIVTFTVDGETQTLGPGGTWRIPSDRPHDLVTGPHEALVVDVFAPTREDWDAMPRLAPRPVAWPGR